MSCRMHSLATALTASMLLWPSAIAAAPHARQATNVGSGCKAIPGDSAWPREQVWDGLNQTIGGRLVATVPQAAVCHPEGYADVKTNEAECAVLANDWNLPKTFFLGKSTGKGGLSLWTHNLKSIDIISYTSTTYTGPAVRVGAGVTGGELLLRASEAGYRVVSGDCPTVGVAGGYSAGGGHGLLNGAYGMAADNVLEWEVVTADGRHLTASPSENADLYWALTGGGAGTYAVVLSMTARLHQDGPVGAATLSFNSTASPDNTSYVAAINAWWEFLPSLIDAGASPAFNFLAGSFLVYNTTAPGKTADEMATLFTPYLGKLDSLGVPYTFATYVAPSYIEHYNVTNGPLPYGPYQASELFNSRIIPRAITSGPEDLTAAMLKAMDLDPAADWQFGCMGLNVNATRIQHPDNAVVPYWRDAVAICLEFSLYDWTVPETTMLSRRQDLAKTIHPMIEAATPGSGAYLNEADPLVYPQGDVAKWQTAFYGTNYPRLREIKDSWDPEGIFYAFTAVGSEDWVEDTEGRLCKA
ncbi:hypothetical protein DL768_006726 [Monosporascus sp. mg162]|nr:hypothetical protein DL768_006726 [Monosporascus sp. mg162]